MTYPIKKLEDLVEFQNGLWTGKKPPFVTAPILRNTNFKNGDGSLNYDDVAEIEVEKKQLEKRTLSKGDILLERSGGGPTQPVGRVVYFEGENDRFGFSNFTTRIRVKDSDVDSKYLWFFLHSFYKSGKTELMQKKTTGIRNLTFSEYKQIEIPLPPLEVQKKIVAKFESLLAKVNEAKKLRAEARESADNLLSAELHKIFEEKKDQEKIKNLSTLINGRGFKTSEWSNSENNTLPIIRIQNLNDKNKGFNHFSGNYDEKILVNNGDLLFSWSGSKGTSFGPHIWEGPKGLLNQHIFKVVYDDNRIDKKYFYFAMKHLVSEVEGNLHGGVGLVHITKTKFEDFSINLPSLTEQKKIVARLDLISQKIEAVKALQNKTKSEFDDLEKSILSKAFNGKLVEGKATAQQPIPSPFHRNQVNAAIIEQVIANGGSTTEVAVAKYNHLLQEIYGVPLGYEFAESKFGPFDAKIKNLIWSGLADKNRWFTKRQGMVVEGQNVGALLARKTNLYWKTKEGMKRLAALGITKLNADKVELLSTVYHSIKQVGSTDLQKIRGFMSNWQTNGNQTKADKFSEEQTQKCIDFIEKNKLQPRS